jgi:nucleotide-binding universal stress UspA family protein
MQDARGGDMAESLRRVVVGVDASEGSRLALRWALDYARRFDAELVVVHAYRSPHAVSSGYLLPGVPEDRADQLGHDLIDELIVAAVGDDEDTSQVRRLAMPGPAAKVLMQAADGADLLVVGGQRRAGVVGAMLGSVAERCVREAPCPVVVVRAVRPALSREPTRVVRVSSAMPRPASPADDRVEAGTSTDPSGRAGPS